MDTSFAVSITNKILCICEDEFIAVRLSVTTCCMLCSTASCTSNQRAIPKLNIKGKVRWGAVEFTCACPVLHALWSHKLCIVTFHSTRIHSTILLSMSEYATHATRYLRAKMRVLDRRTHQNQADPVWGLISRRRCFPARMFSMHARRIATKMMLSWDAHFYV